MNVDISSKKDTIRFDSTDENKKKTLSFLFKEIFEKYPHIVYKAINQLNCRSDSFYRIDNLKKIYDINSIDDFLQSIIAQLKMDITCPSNFPTNKYECFEYIEGREKVRIVREFLEWIAQELKGYDHPFKGSDFKRIKFDVKSFSKEKLIDKNSNDFDENLSLERELSNKTWYVMDGFWGTSEERDFLEYFKKHIGNIEDCFSYFYLVRNEETYKIYDYEEGRCFEPDFLLFMTTKEKRDGAYYQVFVEPKGGQLLEKDKWKNDFLNEISKKYGLAQHVEIVAGRKCYLIGLPFYNSRIFEENGFKEAFEKVIYG